MLSNLILFFVQSSAIFASGWGSVGGGDLSLDSHNPWFLNNVKEVHYCIEVGPDFDRTQQEMQQWVPFALSFWKRNFAETQNRFGIAQQTFVADEACTLKTDIRFQFGTLTQKVENLPQYLALTLRTDYNREQMRGRGFVYFAPTRGPLKPDGRLVKNSAIWKNNYALMLTLIHETGHIFGLTHTPFVNFMQENLCQSLASNSLPQGSAEYWQHAISEVSVFRARSATLSASRDTSKSFTRDAEMDFLGIPASATDWKMELNRDGLSVNYIVNGEHRQAGKALAYDVKSGAIAGSEMRIYFPNERKIYQNSPGTTYTNVYEDFVWGEELSVSAKYQNFATSKESPINYIFSSATVTQRFVIGSTSDGPLVIRL